MGTEIFNVISHIKNVSKKRITDERIKSELRKEDMSIEETDFETAIDNPVSRNHCTKKWSFPLRVSSVNVTKSAERNP